MHDDMDRLVTRAVHVTIDPARRSISSRRARAAWLRPMADKSNLAQHGHEQTCECRSLWERLRVRHMQAAGCSRLFGTAQSVSPNQTFYCAVLDLVLLSSKRTFHNHTVSRRSMRSLFSMVCLQELRVEEILVFHSFPCACLRGYRRLPTSYNIKWPPKGNAYTSFY
jgi:hypothetical protein